MRSQSPSQPPSQSLPPPPARPAGAVGSPSLPFAGGHPRSSDAALAAALFACSFPGSVITFPGQDPSVPWWPGVVLAGASCAALVRRRDRPRGTVVVTLGCAVAASALGYLLTVLLLAPLMAALYSLAVSTDRRTANSFAFTGIALLVGVGLPSGPAGEPLVLKLLGPAAWLLLPTALGTVTRLRAACLDAVRARAEHAERTREEETRRRVTEERMRIARDLHDVVAHHLVLAGLQAGAVARHLPARPEEAARLTADLTGTTASALRELKSTVGLLRRAGDADEPGNAGEPGRPVGATPGLSRLPRLAASFEGAGLEVTLHTEGEPAPITAGAELTAYRIVQEALTNVTKHAGARTAAIRLVYADDRLTVTVTDDGGTHPKVPAPTGGGYGLIGMRERARSAGGRVRTGHRPGGGFEVVTELPLDTRRTNESHPV
ncbi:sensor histidine kinase [Streptomyces sp. NBC_00103]|uniref:sensor histidine kinase n=1 Tax=Streptomyces sp. NBC_00103 TaxID=2975653 RepID=UPI0022577BA1|nr:sensor histidine kinase [Streptomyces sp. NBC_00103]MCX5369210.1 sensor histidine kinase [Streptomyces sp. NBC_00103]